MSDATDPQHGPPTPRTHPVGDDGRPAPPDPDAPTRISETGAGSAQTRLATTHRDVPSGGLPRAWADFELTRELGRGGMGVVYEARQIGLGRTVAVKIMLAADHELRRRFEREARALALVDSPHVVRVFHAGSHGDELYFAMEFVRGQDLAQRLKGGWRPTHAQALGLVRQAAIGLAAAAKHGLIHRDIKPGNMMLADDGTLKLMDFGLVRIADDAQPLTTSGLVMGTVHYFSPEQGMGQKCDHRSDLYSLGVVFFELLTGRRPFSGESAAALIYQHIHAEPPMPRLLDPSIPLGFQRVVLRCMSKRPEQRYQDARELILDLDRLRDGRAPTPRRRALGGIAAAAAALALTAFGVDAWRSRAAAHEGAAPGTAIGDAPARPASSREPSPAAAADTAPVAAARPADHPQTPRPEQLPTPAATPTPPADATLTPAAAIAAHPAPTATDPAPIATDRAAAAPIAPTPETTPAAAPTVAPTTDAPVAAAIPAPVAPTPDVPPAPAVAPAAREPTAVATPTAPPDPPRPPGFGGIARDEHGLFADLAVAGRTARFRWCPSGDFTMGCAGIRDATPHEVTIGHGFWLAETETTQGLWRALGCEDPSKERGDELPVDNCSRDDCEAFLAALRERIPDLRARLPTEAEWEYACRAGGAVAADARVPGHYDGRSAPRAPRGYPPNAWGLYDMIGNVAEWVHDDYAKYPAVAVRDPTGGDGSNGVTRGGYWEESPAACRPASRDHPYLSGLRSRAAGMRIAIDAP